MFLKYLLYIFLASALLWKISSGEADKNGYVLYCPCMGRFGNQADQFLGALFFAKTLDRTLVLPPWVEYPPGSTRSIQVPFDRYFKVDHVAKFHRVIQMSDFMKSIAPSIWQKGNRIALCYKERQGSKLNDCNAREGNPFDSFWATYDIDFDKSEFFEPLYFNVEVENAARDWKIRYPVSRFPVLAFISAPSTFPAPAVAVELHKYAYEFSDFISFKASSFIRENVRRPFVGVHLRNGIDWKNACEHLKGPSTKQHMFTSAQCLGQNFEHGLLSYDHCYPPQRLIVDQISAAVKNINAATVFIATDFDGLKDHIRAQLRELNLIQPDKVDIAIIRQPDTLDAHLDLAILTEADLFIGNCVSSFSAFVARQRAKNGKSSNFFNIFEEQKPRILHDESEL